MSVTTETTYQSTILPDAPSRSTLADAEEDDARGVELAAYLELLPALTDEHWAVAEHVRATAQASSAAYATAGAAAREAAYVAGRAFARRYGFDRARSAAPASRTGLVEWIAARTAGAIVVSDSLDADHFELLTAPMRAAGVDFDALVPSETDSAARLLRSVADVWGANPDACDHRAETTGDVRNQLRDLAVQIERGDYSVDASR